LKIEHIAVWTRDLDRLVAFYQIYFDAAVGAEYLNPKRQFRSRFLTFASGARLELMSMPGIPESLGDPRHQFTGYIHLAVSVGSENGVDELTHRLREAGYPVLDGPRRTGDGYYESAVLDPDGNRIEITV
jgi:lactoylglutathione lyase